MTTSDPVAAFIKAATLDGSLEAAEAVLSAHPEVATSTIHAAAILGDDQTVRRFLAEQPQSSTSREGPLGWDPLTCLSFSRYLRLDRSRTDAFLRTAAALLDAGADAATGYVDPDHRPEPAFESALYGAAGVAHHAALARLLVERGADPNDGEVAYHAPETYDNAVLEVLVESGRLTGDSLTTMLLRKHDWHDYAGIRYLLENGADPNRASRWGRNALQQALLRDNGLPVIELLLDHGSDPSLAHGEPPPAVIAARRGRGDALALFEQRGVELRLEGIDELLAACAGDRTGDIRTIAARAPRLVAELQERAGTLLAAFAGNGNTAGVRHLLDLGLDPAATVANGDGYWQLAPDSTALHVAAWRGRHETVRLLIERGAPVGARDARGRTPLALAVRACVDSYWMETRSPESVEALLQAGASKEGLALPTGYAEIDRLLV